MEISEDFVKNNMHVM